MFRHDEKLSTTVDGVLVIAIAAMIVLALALEAAGAADPLNTTFSQMDPFFAIITLIAVAVLLHEFLSYRNRRVKAHRASEEAEFQDQGRRT